MIRVLLLIDALDVGGAQAMVTPLARALDRGRVELHVIGLNTIHAKHRVPSYRVMDGLRELGVPFIELGSRNLRDWKSFRKLQGQVQGRGIQLIHAHLASAIIWGYLTARWAKIPLITTMHGLIDPPRGTRAWQWEMLARLAARHADRVVCVSNALREFYLDKARLDPARAVTIYNGLELDRFDARRGTRTSMRQVLGLSLEAPVITLVSVLREGKGHDELIAAAPRVLQQFPAARFLIVGAGSREEELRHAAEGLGSAMLFLGTRDDVPAILSASDLLVLPSYSEALPTVVIEAMAARVPVVATRVGGIPEIVREGETGFLIQPREAEELAEGILTCLRNPARAWGMGLAGRARVEAQFDSRRYALALTELYEQVRVEYGAGPTGKQ